MVIILGGSSHVGKTLMAQKLLEKYKYPYISLDHLKMAFIRSGKTDLTVNDDYEMRYFLWLFVSEIIKTAVENKQNLIVEGCYVPGEWKENFTEEYLKEIKCAFITMSENYIRSHFDDIKNYESVIEQRQTDELDLERLIYCSEMFRQQCMMFEITNIDIDKSYDADQIFTLIEKNIAPESF